MKVKMWVSLVAAGLLATSLAFADDSSIDGNNALNGGTDSSINGSDAMGNASPHSTNGNSANPAQDMMGNPGAMDQGGSDAALDTTTGDDDY